MERLFIGSAELELATWCPYATISTTACKGLLLLVPTSWHSCRSSFISEQSALFRRLLRHPRGMVGCSTNVFVTAL